jgi:hypothetical protein
MMTGNTEFLPNANYPRKKARRSVTSINDLPRRGTFAISGSRPGDYPHRPILSRVRCIALFGDGGGQ